MVAHGVDRTHHVDHVGILEAANHVHDGVDFANVRQELITESFALRGALHEARDVDELDDGRNLFFGLDHLVQPVEPRIGNLDHPHVRLHGAERIVLRGGRFRGCQRVEECRFPDIGKANDSETEHQLLSHFSTASIICGRRDSTCSRSSGSKGLRT